MDWLLFRLLEWWKNLGWKRRHILLLEQHVRHLDRRLSRIEFALRHREVDHFCITQRGGFMSILGIIAGQTGQFTATIEPSGAVLPPGQTPAWVSDNPAATIITAPDGLSASVAVEGSATGSFNLTVSVTRTDGSPASGSVAVPILPPPPPEVSSFTIDQTA